MVRNRTWASAVTLHDMRPVTDLQRRVAPFEVISDYQPSGDQPTAITDIERRIHAGESDVVLLGFLQSLLENAKIPFFVADQHISAMEGMIGAFPRRLLVPEDQAVQARRLITDAGLAAELR